MLLLLSFLAVACVGFLLGGALHYTRGYDDGFLCGLRSKRAPDISDHRFVRILPPMPVAPSDHLPS